MKYKKKTKEHSNMNFNFLIPFFDQVLGSFVIFGSVNTNNVTIHNNYCLHIAY